MNSAMQRFCLSDVARLPATHPRQTVRFLLAPLHGAHRHRTGRLSGSFSRRYTARIVTGRAAGPAPSHADSGNPVSVTGAASSPASVSAVAPSTAGVLAAFVPTETVFSIRAWQRDRSGPTEVARISPSTSSGTQKRRYLRK